MSNSEPFTDDTPMPWGKHKETPLKDVPASYLLWIADQPDRLRDYVEANREALEQEVANEKGE